MKPEPLLTDVQRVFLCSKVNGALYLGNMLPEYPRAFPTDTWFRKQLKEVRAREAKIENED